LFINDLFVIVAGHTQVKHCGIANNCLYLLVFPYKMVMHHVAQRFI